MIDARCANRGALIDPSFRHNEMTTQDGTDASGGGSTGTSNGRESFIPAWFLPAVIWIGIPVLLTVVIVSSGNEPARTFPETFGESETVFLSFNLDAGECELGTWHFARDLGNCIDISVDWVTRHWGRVFRLISDILTTIFVWLRDGLEWIPWPAFVVAAGILTWKLGSVRLAIFTVAAFLLLAVFELWESTMETMALMGVTVGMSIGLSVPLGVWSSQNDRVRNILRPFLDGMQTMPSFVYLVPAIALFGLGDVPGMFATLIYSIPPAVRFTDLGIRQVPAEIVEAAESFGATKWQLMFKVKLPLALPTITAGINQTTLMALSMVVIASLVGAGGLGEDVNRALGRLRPGDALLAGMGIVFLAIIIDRVTQAYARRKDPSALENRRAAG